MKVTLKKWLRIFGVVGVTSLCTTSFIGCNNDDINKIKLTEGDKKIIKDYLEDGENSILSNSKNGEIYTAFEVLGTSEDEIYLWVLQETSKGEGASVPVLVNATKKNEALSITGYEMPGDGDMYIKDVEKMFPKYVQEEIFAGTEESNERVNKLKEEIDKVEK